MSDYTVGGGNPELRGEESVLNGCLGALLLSLVGGAATILLLQINVIAGLAGALGIVLGYWGYRRFAKVEHSRKGLWLSIIIAVLVQLAAYYFGIAILGYRELEGMIPFGAILKILPQWISEDAEFRGELLGDLIKLLVFMAVASAYVVVNAMRQIKTAEASEQRGSVLYRDDDCDAD